MTENNKVTVAPTSFMGSEASFAFILAQKEQEMGTNESLFRITDGIQTEKYSPS